MQGDRHQALSGTSNPSAPQAWAPSPERSTTTTSRKNMRDRRQMVEAERGATQHNTTQEERRHNKQTMN
ncbi:hypothetical protein E2C01_085690 [Portunus trituberculatus]|uniref:Uncharacterized protein n=1 Tax=Portunus trituberculatus TaxID=210409 RepID=A0A5B7J892_PORTR|nr:hypothetical protein [Portunus trituberculatus]